MKKKKRNRIKEPWDRVIIWVVALAVVSILGHMDEKTGWTEKMNTSIQSALER